MINEQNHWLKKKFVSDALHSAQLKTASTDQIITSPFCALGHLEYISTHTVI